MRVRESSDRGARDHPKTWRVTSVPSVTRGGCGGPRGRNCAGLSARLLLLLLSLLLLVSCTMMQTDTAIDFAYLIMMDDYSARKSPWLRCTWGSGTPLLIPQWGLMSRPLNQLSDYDRSYQ